MEARTAVQKQIERIFTDASNVGCGNTAGGGGESGRGSGVGGAHQPHLGSKVNLANVMLKKEIKHTMHGVSHALPGADDDDIPPPPPVHIGVDQVGFADNANNMALL